MKFADMHCHIIPAVDDGAESWEQTKLMLDIAYEDGIRIIVATPHYHIGKVKVDRRTIEEEVIRISAYVADRYGDMKIYPGHEIYYYSEAMEDINNNKVCTMGGSGYILMEYSTHVQYEEIRDSIYEAVSEGYKPIIAHAERYMCLIDKPDRVNAMVADGAYIQVNASSVIGKYGKTVKKFITKLLKNDMVHFVASDAHGDTSRRPILSEAADYIRKKFGAECCQKLFYDNVITMLQDEYID